MVYISPINKAEHCNCSCSEHNNDFRVLTLVFTDSNQNSQRRITWAGHVACIEETRYILHGRVELNAEVGMVLGLISNGSVVDYFMECT